MIGFKDRTWCPMKINLRCARREGCYRAFTTQDKEDAEKWWGGPDFPLLQYVSEPDCFVSAQSIRISINQPDGTSGSS